MTNSVAIVGGTLQYATRANVQSPSGVLRCTIHAFHGSHSHIRKQRLTKLMVRAGDEKPPKKKKWWHKFLLQEIDTGSWFDTDDEVPDGDMEEEEQETWNQRADAIWELRDSRENGRDPDSRNWEDWLDDSWSGNGNNNNNNIKWDKGEDVDVKEWDKEGVPREKPSIPERGMYRNLKELLFRVFQNPSQLEDLTYEDKVFQYTTQTTAKFVAFLVLVPWAVDFVFHDYVMVPFLNRYVELVPFAAQLLDVRKDQKLEMVEGLKWEKLRLKFEAEIRMAPPLSEQELWEHMRHKARELREELRLENRKAFANIWSDMVAAITAFLILLFNPSNVEIMKFTGSRIFKGISGAGKAFLLILVTDIFIGYHSESGWHTLIETLLEHYGLMADDAAITAFICIFPVAMDVCFKYWVFKYLPRLSPTTAATFHDIKRH